MKKRPIVLVLCLLIPLAGGGAWWKLRLRPAEASTSLGTAVSVKRGPMRQTVQCTGRITPNLSVDIKCKASGQVIKLPFEVSDTVHQGDLMIEIDPVEQARNVQKAEASLKATRARLAQSRATLVAAEKSLVADRQRAEAVVRSNVARAVDVKSKAQRAQELLAKKYASVEEVETANTTLAQAEQDVATARADVEKLKAQEAELDVKREDVKVCEAEVESDEINLTLAQQYLSETKVMAPIDGVVSARDVQIGQIISSGISNVGGGTTTLSIADMSHIYVLASVDESQIGNVRVGQPVDVTVDAFPREKFNGKVVRIATTGANVSNVITFEVKIEILSANKTMLKPEMTANVEVIVTEKADVLRIPMAALSRTPDGTFVNAKHADGRIAEHLTIAVGVSDGSDIEVVSGLDETDAVFPKATTDSSKTSSPKGGMGPPPM
jgi:multidrug resistance efflux pump